MSVNLPSKLPFAVPSPAGTHRAAQAKVTRDLATEIARTRAHALTRSNGEEADHGPHFPANFTKGLYHDEFGILAHGEDYLCFVEAINARDPNLFESRAHGARDRAAAEGKPLFVCKIKGSAEPIEWRGWESPRAGHVYELEGPDAGSVGMAPAPRVGGSELDAEMAEVYAMAILRDVTFETIREGTSKARLCSTCGDAQMSAAEVVSALNGMRFFSGADPVSSTPHQTDGSSLNRFERNRRFARTQDPADPHGAPLTTQTLFRGSTPGAITGPYVSQFMLIGNGSLAGAGSSGSQFVGTDAAFDLADGFIRYGSLAIDQRSVTHKACLDHMTDWTSWLDVQNGAKLGGTDLFEPHRRFISTPRDLATYVHYDALYEAYLNAALILLGLGARHSKGFPETSPSGRRTGFATFGGPHILSLVTEVATRCLKAVRRQKFNYHRRARPEALGGRYTLAKMKHGAKLGCAQAAFEASVAALPGALVQAIIKHNSEQNEAAMMAMRKIECPTPKSPGKTFAACNLLLPMAFPEGSPMHPAYGAGHATVAGGCVTMLKAFFEMFEDCNGYVERKLVTGANTKITYIPNADGTALVDDPATPEALTIQGELDKLAANIAIGRNMAGVHYYSDYFDSVRMGERIAVGILMEQAPTYGDQIETAFTSFDGDHIVISGEVHAAPSLSVTDRHGCSVRPHDWWLRHVAGEETVLDL